MLLHTFGALIFSVVLVFVGAEIAVFPEGDRYSYQFSNDVFIKDFKNGRPVAYRLVGTVNVANILTADDDAKLLKFTLESPQLHVRPHGSDSQTEFNYHKSPLDNYKNNDFYAIWSAGNVSTIYYDSKENLALVNIKKAIVSLFHYKTSEGAYMEDRASGRCEVSYKDTSPTAMRRMKQNCVSKTKTQHIIRPEEPLQASVQNYRSTDYQFFADGSIEKIQSRDYFHIALEANREIGGSVDSTVVLRTDGHLTKVSKVDSKTPKEFLSQLKNYKSEELATNRQDVDAPINSNIKKAVKEYQDDLTISKIGTVQSAKAFLDILPIARVAKKEDIVELLQSKKLTEIKPQILDILGAAGTVAAHEAVKKVVDFYKDEEFDNVERYLQALAVGSRPNSEIILDLLKVVDNKSTGDKVKITTIHTLGSMARRYAASPNQSYSSEIVAKVQKYFNSSIITCTDIPCYVQYLNGINNLQSFEFVDQLFEYVNDTDRSISVAAMKALRSFPVSVWNKNHIQRFENIFYEIEKRFDSSVRTLALDIVLHSKFSEEQLKKLLTHLKTKDRAFEVKKYLMEMVQMFASENQELNEQVQRIIKSDNELNNYHIIGQKGLTTALSRKYSVQAPFNGTLTSIQEIFGGILKRGVVDLTIDSPKKSYSYFTLGLYSGGLTSFVSSNSDSNEESEEVQDEIANAGMEITVQGSYLRPLQFFNGQGELMGHVWSGTASEPTPAYLANTLLHDHHETLQIQNGATVHIDIESALSIDLNGAIQLSLWGRNAQIQVNKNVGLYIAGKILVNAGFVTLDLNFNLEKAPKLNLNTDVDFSSENILCMQLSQPDDVFRYEMEKNQIIPEIRHHVKSIKKFKYNIAGITHYLNKKNNEMCNKIFAA